MQPDTLVFKFSALVIAIPIVVAVVAAVAGIVLLRMRNMRRFGVIALFVAVMAGGLFIPSMIADRVYVTPTEIYQNTGLPLLAQTRKGFKYSEAEYVHLLSEGSEVGQQSIWLVHLKSGGTRRIDPGDLWEHNEDSIIPALKERGVQFEGRGERRAASE